MQTAIHPLHYLREFEETLDQLKYEDLIDSYTNPLLENVGSTYPRLEVEVSLGEDLPDIEIRLFKGGDEEESYSRLIRASLEFAEESLRNKLHYELFARKRGFKNENRAEKALKELVKEENIFSFDRSETLEDWRGVDFWTVWRKGFQRKPLQIRSSESGLYYHWKRFRNIPAARVSQDMPLPRIKEKLKNIIVNVSKDDRILVF